MRKPVFPDGSSLFVEDPPKDVAAGGSAAEAADEPGGGGNFAFHPWASVVKDIFLTHRTRSTK